MPWPTPKQCRRSAPRSCLRRWCIGLATLLCAGSACAQSARPDPRQRLDGASEIAPFRLTGYEGHVELRYLQDDNLTRLPAYGQSTATESRQGQSTFRVETLLVTHAYVYHPNLLSLDIGGGPIFDVGRASTDGVLTRSNTQLYNLFGRATFLREKPYRGSLFYERMNPVQSVGPAQVMLTETERYGFDASLLAPVTPVPLKLDGSRSHTRGSGAGQTQDDRIDQIGLSADSRVGSFGNSKFRYQATRQDSQSGSVGLPIQSARSRSDGANLDTNLRFGANKQYELYNDITLGRQNTRGGPTSQGGQGAIVDQRDTRFYLNLRGQHSEALQTNANYSFNDVANIDQNVVTRSLGAGLSYLATPRLTTTLRVRGDQVRSTQVNSSSTGMNGSATYRLTLPVGAATASYSASYLVYDQQAMQTQARIVGESMALAGTTPVALLRQRVVEGSVVVSNATRSQTFVEGLDYVLSTLGTSTRVERLIGGNIIDGQDVLVDYSYDVGGTYALARLDQALSLNWALRSLANVYLRLSDTAPTLRSGTPTFQLNPSNGALVGARADLPLDLLPELMVGGFAEHESHHEVVSPYQRTAFEAYAQLALPIGRGNLRLGTQRTRTDYDYAPLQGVNLAGVNLRLWSQRPSGMNLSLELGRERDTGATILRERTFVTASVQWRVRQFRMSFDLRKSRDVQGSSDRSRTYANLLLRRDF